MTLAKEQNFTHMTYSYKDYIQNGLIAMWDGEWNTGYGNEHDKKCYVWKDLISQKQLISSGSCSWGNTFLEVSEEWRLPNNEFSYFDQFFLAGNVTDGGYTIEIVLNVDYNTKGRNIFGDRYLNMNIFVDDNNSRNISGWLSNGYNTRSMLESGKFGTVSFITRRPYLNVVENLSYTNGILGNVYNDRSFMGYKIGQKFGIGLGEYPNWGIATGKIYCIRMYKRHLTETEITENYQIDKNRFGV